MSESACSLPQAIPEHKRARVGSDLPLPKHRHQERGNANRAAAGESFGRANHAPFVGTLFNGDGSGFQVNSIPRQATNLARSQAGIDRRSDQGSPSSPRLIRCPFIEPAHDGFNVSL